MRLDTLFYDHPGQELGRAVSGISDQFFCGFREVFLDAFDPGLRRPDFLSAMCRGRLDIHDNAGLGIHQVVGRVGVIRRATGCRRPAGSRIGL